MGPFRTICGWRRRDARGAQEPWHTRLSPLPHGRGSVRAAFTVVEVLATIVLIGIVVPVVMSGISLALSAAEHSRNLAQAATLGEAKLTELVATGQWQMNTASGDFSPDWPQFHWTLQRTTRDFESSELALQVTWTERGVEDSWSVSTLAFDNGTMTQGVLP